MRTFTYMEKCKNNNFSKNDVSGSMPIMKIGPGPIAV